MGRRTSAASVRSPFGHNDVRKRHATQAGEATHTPSTSWIGRAKHDPLVHSTLTGPPPLTPRSQWGETREHARGICATNSERASGAIPTLHHPSLALPVLRKAT